MEKLKNRLSLTQLDEACLDCCDLLAHPCVECEDCPIDRLKIRIKQFGDSSNE